MGALEVGAVVGMLAGLRWEWMAVAAATGLAALMLGAVFGRRRANDTRGQLPLAVLFVLSAALAVITTTQLS